MWNYFNSKKNNSNKMCLCSVCVCVEREIHGINHFKWSAEIILGYGCGEKERPAFNFFLKILFIYLTERKTVRKRGNTSRGSGRGRSRLPTEEPDVRLNQDSGITP